MDSFLSFLVVVSIASFTGAQDITFGSGRERVAAGATCWYPNYYCAFNPSNRKVPGTVSPGYYAATAMDCYNDCNANKTASPPCNQFTWINLRGVPTCFLLEACNLEHRIYDDVCLVRDKCVSGPSDCTAITNTAPCTVPSPMPRADYLKWQCEDGQSGAPVNIYDGSVTINAGTRCLQSCDSWRIDRYSTSLSPLVARGALYSVCQENGTWSETLPTDSYDGTTSLSWPSYSLLGLSSYPEPDNDATGAEKPIKCACEDLTLVWPPSSQMATASSTSMSNQFYYNPRDEPGTDFECENEIHNDVVNATGQFKIESGNICRLFCDTYFVATVQCIDGKWRGGADLGMWCYEYPQLSYLGSVV